MNTINHSSAFAALYETQYFERHFSNLSPSVMDPTHINYAWNYKPLGNVQKVLVPINDFGDTAEFKQFRPSKIKINYFEMLKHEVNSELDELLNEISVFNS